MCGGQLLRSSYIWSLHKGKSMVQSFYVISARRKESAHWVFVVNVSQFDWTQMLWRMQHVFTVVLGHFLSFYVYIRLWYIIITAVVETIVEIGNC